MLFERYENRLNDYKILSRDIEYSNFISSQLEFKKIKLPSDIRKLKSDIDDKKEEYSGEAAINLLDSSGLVRK